MGLLKGITQMGGNLMTGMDQQREFALQNIDGNNLKKLRIMA